MVACKPTYISISVNIDKWKRLATSRLKLVCTFINFRQNVVFETQYNDKNMLTNICKTIFDETLWNYILTNICRAIPWRDIVTNGRGRLWALYQLPLWALWFVPVQRACQRSGMYTRVNIIDRLWYKYDKYYTNIIQILQIEMNIDTINKIVVCGRWMRLSEKWHTQEWMILISMTIHKQTNKKQIVVQCG